MLKGRTQVVIVPVFDTSVRLDNVQKYWVKPHCNELESDNIFTRSINV